MSNIRYKVNRKNPFGRQVFDVTIGGKPLELDGTYTFTHNDYCTRPENIEKYLHLKPGAVQWKITGLLCREAVADYARHLKTIDYPSGGAGRIEVIH